MITATTHNSLNGRHSSPGRAKESPAATPVLIDVQAVAQMLSCSTRQVYRLADGGLMPAKIKLGALVRWDRAAVEAWIATGCKPVRR